MNRAVIAGVVTGALVIGLGATLLILTGDGDTEPATGQAAATSPASASPDATEEAEPSAGAAASTTSASAGGPADDPLCQLHDERVQALDGHLPVENSEDLMAVSEAQLAF